MTWTYSTALATTKDQVRLVIGDVLTTDQQLQDEEIAFFVTNEPNVYYAAVACCRALMARYSRQVQRSAGQQSIASDQRIAHYRDLASELLVRGATANVIAFGGGISEASKETYEDDDDRVVPFAAKEQHTVVGNTPFESDPGELPGQ